ncbi:hypothetical protein NKH77_55750 [Streptomyces sp. M19]
MRTGLGAPPCGPCGARTRGESRAGRDETGWGDGHRACRVHQAPRPRPAGRGRAVPLTGALRDGRGAGQSGPLGSRPAPPCLGWDEDDLIVVFAWL